MNMEFTDDDIYPFFKTFQRGADLVTLKAQLSLISGYNSSNIEYKLNQTVGRTLSRIEKDGIKKFYLSEYQERVAQYLANK